MLTGFLAVQPGNIKRIAQVLREPSGFPKGDIRGPFKKNEPLGTLLYQKGTLSRKYI